MSTSRSPITLVLATDEDAPTLAEIMTHAFAASDAAYPLIWGSTAPGTHEKISKIGLFTPVQKPGTVTIKAVHQYDPERVLGFATWSYPKSKLEGEGEEKKTETGGLPPIPGVNIDLWHEKVTGPRRFAEKDCDTEKDMSLSFCFVLPEEQGQGIGRALLEWGKKEADKRRAKVWLTATPQAASVYEACGWKVKERVPVDLVKFGGEGIYERVWMCRDPQ